MLLRDHRLVALPGGRHPGAGTANAIVPCGAAYLELISVVDADAAGRSPTGRRVRSALERGSTFAGWALRTQDLDSERDRLAAQGLATEGPLEGSRLRPDGVLLRWRTLHVAAPDPGCPFLIEWAVPEGQHPAERPVEHPAGRVEIEAVEVAAADSELLGKLVGELDSFALAPSHEPGVVRVRLRTGAGPEIIE